MDQAEYTHTHVPSVSTRIQVTDTPVIALTSRLMALRPDVISLAQGVVYWSPPPEALETAQKLITDPAVSRYGPNEGLPALRAALRQKLADKNGLHNHDLCVTHGANQAFINIVLSLVDSSDPVVLFKPVYFDHLMTITQTGGADNIVWGECDPVTLHPSIDWLREALSAQRKPKMVVICNPCNPTGALLSRQELQKISDLCAAAGCWLVVDETYEDFTYDNREHTCISGPHVLHIFSFSKAYGLMGWRVGYIAYPNLDGKDTLGAEFLKCQDTVCICATQLSQHMALAALQQGEEYKQQKLATLEGNRQLVLDALSPLGSLGDGTVAGGEGAIYFWIKLPPGCEDDVAAVEWLVKYAGVCLVPGSSCAAPGWARVSFGNRTPEDMQLACTRLKSGLQTLVKQGNLQPPPQQQE